MKKLAIGLFALAVMFIAAGTANASETANVKCNCGCEKVCNCECCKKGDCDCGTDCKCHRPECTCKNCDCTCPACKKSHKFFKKKHIKCNCEK